MATKIAVIYYSATGHVHQLADAIADGAREAGAEVRLRRVPELAPREAIEANEAWARHADEIAAEVPEATLDDLDWADGFALGSPTRYGNVAAQLKQFIDTTGGLWSQGKLADKAATSFTSAMNTHGGQESTILSLNNVFYHWGAIIVTPGYTDPLVFAAGGNPYGANWIAGQDVGAISEEVRTVARYQGKRLAEVAAKLRGQDDADPVPADQAEAYTRS
jgi:NAD(P)H dehydrogenase (quinone)